MRHSRALAALLVASAVLLFSSCDEPSNPTQEPFDAGASSDADAVDASFTDTAPPAPDAEAPSDAEIDTADSAPDLPDDCPAAESEGISALLGGGEEGQTLVICGRGFGTQGPTTFFLEDFEAGQAGASLQTDATRGQWLDPKGTYVDDDALSGINALLVADHIETEGRGVSAVLGFPDDQGDFGLKHFNEFFVHWSMRDLGDFPGHDSSPTSFSSDSSAKDIWVMYGDRGDNYDYSCSRGSCNGNDIVLATHTGQGSFKHDGNNTNSNWWIGGYWAFQQWNTLSTYLKINPEDPYGATTGVFEHLSAGQGVYRSTYNEGVLREDLTEIPPVWDRLKFGAWYRTAGDVRRLMDEIYVAVGPGAAARVEVANAPNFDEATRVIISPVNAWTDTRIEVDLRLADLATSDEELYLFVVDAHHRRSAGVALSR
ncbi:hypothetical protein DL240_00265 [Lujinxingia litoralis]|uniref:IPT/TIG domain-containing protein n=1 Tax=Lujinxingia litoralis TaxID=2211119 RepID=A0A328C9Q6_9DELT|nr:hypothetical protein [Lujinxingia litoralis]RAL24678.1 hypothetical protein DL240_00265 [Lujinxingia litoralis]